MYLFFVIEQGPAGGPTSFSLDVKFSESVAEIKRKILTSQNMSIDSQLTLIFKGQVLEDEHDVSYYHILPDSTIEIIVKASCSVNQSCNINDPFNYMSMLRHGEGSASSSDVNIVDDQGFEITAPVKYVVDSDTDAEIGGFTDKGSLPITDTDDIDISRLIDVEIVELKEPNRRCNLGLKLLCDVRFIKTVIETVLRIPSEKQILSVLYKDSVPVQDKVALPDDMLLIEIPDIISYPRIELTSTDDAPPPPVDLQDPSAPSSSTSGSNKRFKNFHVKNMPDNYRIVGTWADTIREFREDVSKSLVLRSNGKELQSDDDFQSLLHSGSADIEVLFGQPSATALLQSNDDFKSLLQSGSADIDVIFGPSPTDFAVTSTASAAVSNAAVSASVLLPSARELILDAGNFYGGSSSSGANIVAAPNVDAKRKKKSKGKGARNEGPVRLSIVVQLSAGESVPVEVKKSDKVEVLRQKLVEVKKNNPALTDLVPQHYLFTKNEHMILDDISFLRNFVQQGDTIRVVPQLEPVLPPNDNHNLITIHVSKRVGNIKVALDFLASKTVGKLKEELAKQKRMRDLGFTLPKYYSYCLFHEQASTRHLFQLLEDRSLSMQRVCHGDTVYVVPKDPLKLKVTSKFTGMTVDVQVKPTEDVRKLRESLPIFGDDLFPLPAEAYAFVYKEQYIMDEGKPFFWHHIVGDNDTIYINAPPR